MIKIHSLEFNFKRIITSKSKGVKNIKQIKRMDTDSEIWLGKYFVNYSFLGKIVFPGVKFMVNSFKHMYI